MWRDGPKRPRGHDSEPEITRSLRPVPAPVDLYDELALLQLDDVAADRQARRFASTLEREDTTFVGALMGLAEHSTEVSLYLTSHTLHGRIARVGSDVVELRPDQRGHRFVRLASIRRLTTRTKRPTGNRTGGSLSFEEVLREGSNAQARVQLWFTHDDAPLTGTLQATGHDVVSLEDVSAREGQHLIVASAIEAVNFVDERGA